jgi:hypothetical protein
MRITLPWHAMTWATSDMWNSGNEVHRTAWRGRSDRSASRSARAEILEPADVLLGLAIPHARLKGLSRPVGVFVRTKLGIPFDAPTESR